MLLPWRQKRLEDAKEREKCRLSFSNKYSTSFNLTHIYITSNYLKIEIHQNWLLLPIPKTVAIILEETYMPHSFQYIHLVFRGDVTAVKGILTKTNFDHSVIILCLDINVDNIECVGIKYRINF